MGRDRELLAEVFLMRAGTRSYLQRRGILPSTSVANSRLRRLFDGGYLRRLFVPAGAHATQCVYTIGRAAVSEVVALLGIERNEVDRLANQPSSTCLQHSLVACAVRLAFESPMPHRVRWFTEPGCRLEYEIRTPLSTHHHVFKPDGAVLLSSPGARLFFLEVDRGTVSRPQFARCCNSYLRYFARGFIQEHYGVDLGEVLCVTTGGQRRIEHLAAVALREGLPVRFAELDTLERLGPYCRIWSGASGEKTTLLGENV
jgi:hypothetical protein